MRYTGVEQASEHTLLLVGYRYQVHMIFSDKLLKCRQIIALYRDVLNREIVLGIWSLQYCKNCFDAFLAIARFLRSTTGMIDTFLPLTRISFENMSNEGNGNHLQYTCLENSRDRGAWWAIIHRVRKVRHDIVTKPPTTTSSMSLPMGTSG